MILENRALGYELNAEETRVNARVVYVPILTGGGSLYSTAKDLARWDQGLARPGADQGREHQTLVWNRKCRRGMGRWVAIVLLPQVYRAIRKEGFGAGMPWPRGRGGGAYTIPKLFFGESFGGGSVLTRLNGLAMLGTEKIGDDECHVVSGRLVNANWWPCEFRRRILCSGSIPREKGNQNGK
ncbi:MAG: hypothetical protein M2R45_05252 [Verrucomicrobia subdivision 3 bacterium]|nr:hypothetical protein [Limisphaerales bacterium]MCS1416850.1 hypothetical protein [Limisphaerales bacterium]